MMITTTMENDNVNEDAKDDTDNNDEYRKAKVGELKNNDNTNSEAK